MATQKPIATISYNSEYFLKKVLDELYKSHRIQAYQYICHKGEDGDKDHIHLRIEPNVRLDPMDLTELFKELDLDHPDKPLGVRPWRSSKEEDWYLYAVHNENYLKLKYGEFEHGEKIPYEYTEIKVSPDYDLDVAFTRALASLRHTAPAMMTALKQGTSAVSLIEQGMNPFLVSTCYNVTKQSDYNRVISANDALRKANDILACKVEQLEMLLCSYGICYEWDDESFLIAPKGTFISDDDYTLYA